jgi:hypothetical protein
MMLTWSFWLGLGALGFGVGCLAVARFISHSYRPDDDDDLAEPMHHLLLYTIYDHPTDYPNHFAVRRECINAGVVTKDPHVYLAPTLEEARRLLPPGLHQLPRNPNDDPKIVECWL